MSFDNFDRHLDAAQIQAYLDGELGDTELAVQAHVDGCARCRAEVEAWTALLENLNSLGDLVPAEGFAARVMSRTHLSHVAPERIQGYVDGTLPRAASESVELHLSTCAVCQEEAWAWRDLFAALSTLPELRPADAFADRVLDKVSVEPRLGLAARLGRKLGLSRPAAPVEHLVPGRLQDFLDGALPKPQMARVQAHLDACDGCRREADAWSLVMGELALLPRVSPSDDFADQVMARVRPKAATAVAPAAPSGVAEWAARLLPSTRRTWAMASTLAMAPATALTVLGVYLFSRPQVTPTSLMLYLWWKVSEAGRGLATWGAEALGGMPVVAQVQQFTLGLASTPSLLVGAGLAFSAMTLMAVWVLYRNVLSPSLERRKYASVTL
jgi:anti-sigma factor RsiW